DFTIENILPRVWLINHPGDFCYVPVTVNMKDTGVVTASINIDGHSIGEGFEEKETSMGCLFGPQGYKSSWLKIHLETKQKVDLSFKMEEQTSVLADDIRYRVLFGNCDAMYAGPCNTNSLTEFTLNCMLGGDYYIQVISPENATGTLAFTMKTVITEDTTCISTDPNKIHAEFNIEPYCPEDTIKFINKSSKGQIIKYFWQFGNSMTSDVFNPSLFMPSLSKDSTINTRLVVKDTITGLSDTITKPLLLYTDPKYIANAGEDKIFCGMDSILIGSPPVNGYVYQWVPSTGLSDPEISQPYCKEERETQYSVAVRWHLGNCPLRSDTVVIRYHPAPVINFPDQISLCKNEKFLLKVDGIRDDKYKWTDSLGELLSANDSLIITKTGKYFVSLSYDNCTYSDTITVTTPKAMFSPAVKDGEAPAEIKFINNSAYADNYKWLFGDNDSTTIDNPIHTYNKEGEYKVILYAYTSNNCIDSVSYSFVKITKKPDVTTSNVFTPNNDGVNDRFIVSIKDAVNFHGIIFDRWGRILFEWYNIEEGWDGRYNGIFCDEGVYFYIINATLSDGKSVERKGWFELLK
ncbi:MAG: gliding motility-associated C-terminal domain-containing protein, partial [Bacteroidota bacterium]|nr:gliding motility-associated C-terminal domain-containing protein [Bacteroidota bacterium]